MEKPKTLKELGAEHRLGLEKVDMIFGGMRNPERRIYADQYERSFAEGARAVLEFCEKNESGWALDEVPSGYISIDKVREFIGK